MSINKNIQNGFSIIELIVVIVVIGILSAIVLVSYTSIQEKAMDTSVLADVNMMNVSQLRYSQNTGEAGKVYYSASGYDSELGFTPNSGNVIDVVVSSTDYCIRGYNTRGSKKTIYNAFIKESSLGACSAIGASTVAIANSGGQTSWLKLSNGGSSHSCAINTDNKAYCWGRNTNGQLGDNSIIESLVPIAVNTSGVLSGKTVKSISSGYVHTCAIASDDKAYCWGRNVDGQLGDNTIVESHVPVAVDTSGVLSGKTIKSITSGLYHTCAIASDDKAYCWGRNSYGQLGNNTTTTPGIVPVAVDTTGVLNGKTVKSIAPGKEHTCAIASDDKAYCWGRNTYGYLGNNSIIQSLVPVAVDTTGVLSGKTIKFISSNNNFTCTIASDNWVYCWGSNNDGRLGDNTVVNSLVPVSVYSTGVLSGKTIKFISTAYSNTCAIASDDKAYCWGQNSDGEHGNNTIAQSSVPVAVDTSGVLSGKTIKSIGARSAHTCAIASDDRVYCWGDNNNGQLGNNSIINSLVPVATTPAS